MKRLSLLLMSAVLITCFGMYGAFRNETLHYVISYKWGLIHKDAGTATLTLVNSGPDYKLMLAARTMPWADRFYRTRDTLTATVKRANLQPVDYTKITHEKNTHSRDEIKYSSYGNVTKGETVRYRNRDGKTVAYRTTLTASGPVYDMLSVFYYLRSLDYSSLSRAKSYKATVFSGKKSETITIRNMGLEKIKLKDKTSREAWHIRFNFTTGGGRKSSDDIDTWISTDERHIPLYLVGKLPVGEVRAYYIR